MYVWIFTEGWIRSQSRPHLPRFTDKQSWRGVELGIHSPHCAPKWGFVDTHCSMLDNDNSTIGGLDD